MNAILRPEDFDQWELKNGVEATSYDAFPLKLQLAPLTDLLTTEGLGVSADRVRDYFLVKYTGYCTNTTGLTRDECDVSFQGCGLIGHCEASDYCLNNPAAPRGYRCCEIMFSF